MTPEWAEALVAAVCAEAGVRPPVLRWRHAAREASSGVARRSQGTVAVTAGRDPVDQRLTLLHELAHWLAPPPARRGRRGRVAHHDATFYRFAFALYARYEIAPADALGREGGRYPSALRHARALGVPGAEEAWSARRTALRARSAARLPARILVAEHRVSLVRDGRWTRCGVCGVRIVGPNLARLRRRGGRHTLLSA
jgi:hypothetical protein